MRMWPAARSYREYDHSARPWYRKPKVHPHVLTVTSTYLDAFGSGKLVSLARPVFKRQPTTCQGVGVLPISEDDSTPHGQLLGPGCLCNVSSQCAALCYKGRCSSEEYEGVTSVDINYAAFETSVIAASSGHTRSCGKKYKVQGQDRETRCYIVDSHAQLAYSSDFSDFSDGNTREFEGVGLGYKEGQVMRDLVYRHKFFKRRDTVDFQGECRTTPFAEAANLDGMVLSAKEKDDFLSAKGRFPPLSGKEGCIQDATSFRVNTSVLSRAGGVLTGPSASPCGDSGPYMLTSIPDTNTYLLVIQDWTDDLSKAMGQI
jgi:hypothetical protein